MKDLYIDVPDDSDLHRAFSVIPEGEFRGDDLPPGTFHLTERCWVDDRDETAPPTRTAVTAHRSAGPRVYPLIP